MTPTEEASKRYLIVTLGLILALTGSLAAFNYTVDPYGIYQDWKEGDVYPAAGTYERIHKTERIKRLKPDVIVLGTSRANNGLNPRQTFFPGLKPYNAAVAATTIYEQRRMLEFAHKVHPLKKVILAIDFIMFNTRRLDNRHFEEERTAPDALSPVNSFINRYGTAVSFNTLLISLRHHRYLKTIERRSYPKANGHKQHNEGSWRVKKDGLQSIFTIPPEVRRSRKNFSFAFSERPGDDSFQHYKAMLEFCRKEGIDLYVMIGPVHQVYLQMFVDNGMWEAVEKWKRTITEITRPYRYTVWDFATFNSLTTEPVPPAGDTVTQMKWFWDTNHYKEVLGDIILKKILGLPGKDEHPDFGKKLL